MTASAALAGFGKTADLQFADRRGLNDPPRLDDEPGEGPVSGVENGEVDHDEPSLEVDGTARRNLNLGSEVAKGWNACQRPSLCFATSAPLFGPTGQRVMLCGARGLRVLRFPELLDVA